MKIDDSVICKKDFIHKDIETIFKKNNKYVIIEFDDRNNYYAIDCIDCENSSVICLFCKL